MSSQASPRDARATGGAVEAGRARTERTRAPCRSMAGLRAAAVLPLTAADVLAGAGATLGPGRGRGSW